MTVSGETFNTEAVSFDAETAEEWYFRVLQEGMVSPGVTLSPVKRRHPQSMIAAANGVMHRGVGETKALAALEKLSAA
jgi:MOSC domain-containing protein YiiM